MEYLWKASRVFQKKKFEIFWSFYRKSIKSIESIGSIEFIKSIEDL